MANRDLQVGDRVMLSPTHDYPKYDECNPVGVPGTVVPYTWVSAQAPYWIQVRWDNGSLNVYHVDDDSLVRYDYTHTTESDNRPSLNEVSLELSKLLEENVALKAELESVKVECGTLKSENETLKHEILAILVRLTGLGKKVNLI